MYVLFILRNTPHVVAETSDNNLDFLVARNMHISSFGQLYVKQKYNLPFSDQQNSFGKGTCMIKLYRRNNGMEVSKE